MRFTIPRAARFHHLAVAVLLLAAAQGAVAQTALTFELVDQRIAVLRASGTPSDNLTLTAYEQARALLNEADSYSREAATYVESLTSAPQREAEIQRRLDERDEAYDPAREVEGLSADELTHAARLGRCRAARAAEPARDDGSAPRGEGHERHGHPRQDCRNRPTSRRLAGRHADARSRRGAVAGRSQSVAQRGRGRRPRRRAPGRGNPAREPARALQRDDGGASGAHAAAATARGTDARDRDSTKQRGPGRRRVDGARHRVDGPRLRDRRGSCRQEHRSRPATSSE